MQAAGVRTIVDARSLSVAGIVEVVAHIPRIYGEFRKLVRAAASEKPDVAVLTDSPDFHLRLAKKLKKQGVPVIYLIAPQVWAWRPWRARAMKRDLRRLLCIFPFEKSFFDRFKVPVTYIGHPLARIVRPSTSASEFRTRFQIPEKPIITLLPGSRRGEGERHMPFLIDAVARIGAGYHYILALPPGFDAKQTKFWERIQGSSIQVIEGCTWDALAHAELALAASGTVTMEAAMLGTPMVTFYRVNALSWILGRWLVRAPFLSMVNLVAGRRVVPELIQQEMTAERIAREAELLLQDSPAREAMRDGLREVAASLATERDPMEIAAEWIEKVSSESKEIVHAR